MLPNLTYAPIYALTKSVLKKSFENFVKLAEIDLWRRSLSGKLQYLELLLFERGVPPNVLSLEFTKYSA